MRVHNVRPDLAAWVKRKISPVARTGSPMLGNTRHCCVKCWPREDINGLGPLQTARNKFYFVFFYIGINKRPCFLLWDCRYNKNQPARWHWNYSQKQKQQEARPTAQPCPKRCRSKRPDPALPFCFAFLAPPPFTFLATWLLFWCGKDLHVKNKIQWWGCFFQM